MMQEGDYGVRVIRPYANMTVGRVIYPPGLLRDKLVKGGFVERLAPAPKDAKPEPKRRHAE